MKWRISFRLLSLINFLSKYQRKKIKSKSFECWLSSRSWCDFFLLLEFYFFCRWIKFEFFILCGLFCTFFMFLFCIMIGHGTSSINIHCGVKFSRFWKLDDAVWWLLVKVDDKRSQSIKAVVKFTAPEQTICLLKFRASLVVVMWKVVVIIVILTILDRNCLSFGTS